MEKKEMLESINANDSKKKRLEEYKSKCAFKRHISESEVEELKIFEEYIEYLYNSPEST